MYYTLGKNNIEQSNPAGVRNGDGNRLRRVFFFFFFFFFFESSLFNGHSVTISFIYIHVCTYYKSYREHFLIKLLTKITYLYLITCMHYFKYIY